jgi:Fe-S cluster assembly iron-binding protein IscA
VQISITAAAEKFIRRMIRYGNLAGGGGFRLAVSPGGCSGLAAQFDVVGEPRAGDDGLEHNGLKLFLPPESRLAFGVIFHDPKCSGSACGTPASASVDPVNLRDAVRRAGIER